MVPSSHLFPGLRVGANSAFLLAWLCTWRGSAQTLSCSDFGFATESADCAQDHCLLHAGSTYSPLWEVSVRECAACDTSNKGKRCETFGGIDRQCTFKCGCKRESGASPVCCGGDPSMVCKQNECVTVQSLQGRTCGNNPNWTLQDLGDGLQKEWKCASGEWDEVVTTTTTTTTPLRDPPSVVADFDCNLNAQPIQILLVDGGFELRSLDVLSGNYSLVYALPFSMTTPPYVEINACGISPKNSRIYCAMRMPNSITYLVTLDATKIAFVGQLPRWFFSAGFSLKGESFYLLSGGRKSRLYTVEHPDQMPAYADHLDPRLADLRRMPFYTTGFSGSADLIAVEADLEGLGPQEYLLTVTSFLRVVLLRLSGTLQTWDLTPEFSPAVAQDGTMPWGAGWTYKDRIFFALNSGGGVYELLLDTLNLETPSISLSRVGPSAETNNNDGLNCLGVDSPWVPPPNTTTVANTTTTVTTTMFQGEITEPSPAAMATNVLPDQELSFTPTFTGNVLGFEVFLSVATDTDMANDTLSGWHLACRLPCGTTVCRPPSGLDSSLGGNFAWRVDTLLEGGRIITGPTWRFSMLQSMNYTVKASGDTYIDSRLTKNYGHLNHMKIRRENCSNPEIGFVRFNITAPADAGIGSCRLNVTRAILRLHTVQIKLNDLKVYSILPEEADFDENTVTAEDLAHPGGAFPGVFRSLGRVVGYAFGPVKKKTAFDIDVTLAVRESAMGGNHIVSFGLTTQSLALRICANGQAEKDCAPQLLVSTGLTNCTTCEFENSTVAMEAPAVSDMCSSNPMIVTNESLEATCWLESPIEQPLPLSEEDEFVEPPAEPEPATCSFESECSYYGHVCCPPPYSNISCSGDQCCPDQSTCPSSKFSQAAGCNVKKFDCTTRPTLNLTCREAEETRCPGTNVTCAGDTCCPGNTTCPSATLLQVPGCGPKIQDCDAILPEGETCAIGEFVQCPNSAVKCHGDQCCPDQSTCPSAPSAIAPGCLPKKSSCALLGWNVSLRVQQVVFPNVTKATHEEVRDFTIAVYSTETNTAGSSVHVDCREGSFIVDGILAGSGGRSQMAFDGTVEDLLLTPEIEADMSSLLLETTGLEEAASGEMIPGSLLSSRAAAEVVSYSMALQNIDYQTLTADEALLTKFIAAVKESIVSQAGNGLNANDIDVVVKVGEYLVEVVIDPPAGVEVSALERLVTAASALIDVATKVTAIDGIQVALQGDLSVAVGFPTFNSTAAATTTSSSSQAGSASTMTNGLTSAPGSTSAPASNNGTTARPASVVSQATTARSLLCVLGLSFLATASTGLPLAR
eukprot:CAMPEP_0170587580 /NCGR_PEP_ID=MMETSP0224-20130122/10359_1 /TAXON_ID=285029 /ORGANISM="Togula jolla, Strain CCCM 725" /LENGTH=1310 /DNA_ID=CAMNT_0010911213 /DNA_START=18 /DNA_END=3950 /DNA_ORIENTATION=+